MTNLYLWKSDQTVTSLFLPRNGHITHTTINILYLCSHGIHQSPARKRRPGRPAGTGNRTAVITPQTHNLILKMGKFLRKRKSRILIIMWP